MILSKDALKILKLANEHETINFEDGCMAISDSKHAAYAPENFKYLEENGLIVVSSEMMPEEYERTTIRITPKGQAALEEQRGQTREKWITRTMAIAAVIISAVSLIWQILSAVSQR